MVGRHARRRREFLAVTSNPAALGGVITSGTGGVWRVLGDDRNEYEAVLRGKLKTAPAMKLAVGDRVRLERDTRERGWAIVEILPRTSCLARRAPAGGGERVIAANIDQVIVMFAAAKPEPHPRMLDRFLVIAEANDIASRIIINKIELVEDGEVRDRFADYEKAGYPVHFVSVKQRVGLESVDSALSGRTSVISGPSGVGKSSLLNALFPGLGLRVSEISESVNKGRHTTVGAFLHPLPGSDGGAVVDTPGLREIGLWEFPIARLDECFPELRGPSEACRFTDCAHVSEPGCSVRGAVDTGDVSRARYESYLKLRREIEEQANE
jgi:ribosome biogenesis GTPase